VNPQCTKRTDLASGQLNGSDRLTVELIEPPNPVPPVVAITRPSRPTTCTPAQLDAVVAAAMRILANAVVELAGLRVSKRL
jgi:hypothetical protein